MTRKRWQLIALWVAAVILTIIGAGAYVYQAARGAVEEYGRVVNYRVLGTLRKPEVRFRSVRFSRDSWIEIEFDVDIYSGPNRPDEPVFIITWGLLHWSVTGLE